MIWLIRKRDNAGYGKPNRPNIFEEENYDTVWNNLTEYKISNKSKAYIFNNEVQNHPDLSRVVKYLYDHWDVKFFSHRLE
jgi:hypothetical protein